MKLLELLPSGERRPHRFHSNGIALDPTECALLTWVLAHSRIVGTMEDTGRWYPSGVTLPTGQRSVRLGRNAPTLWRADVTQFVLVGFVQEWRDYRRALVVSSSDGQVRL